MYLKQNCFFEKRARIFWLFGIFLLLLVGPGQSCLSQENKESLKEILRREIKETEAQIKDYENIIVSKQAEVQTLANEIKIFDAEIKKAELEIKKTELALAEIEQIIKEKEGGITKIENFMSQRKILLSEFLKTIYELDEYSFLEIILKNNKISDFFNDVQTLQEVHNSLQAALKEIRKFKKDLEIEKEAYEEERQEQLSLRNLQKLQERDLKDKREGRKSLLKVTKGEEAQYQKLMKEAKKSVTEIKKQLFILEGATVTFEEAFAFAKFASEKTGVRPAFLLAVLSVETKLGIDLGRGNWKKDMKSADREAFEKICKKLNLDPDLMPVSRRPSSDYWGGAMGPAQFLPRTWLIYENEISQLTGNNPPNPWDLKDAFVAAALKLAKDGANLKTYDAERKAALIFFAGGRWNYDRYAYYGDRVMRQAEVFQGWINILEGK